MENIKINMKFEKHLEQIKQLIIRSHTIKKSILIEKYIMPSEIKIDKNFIVKRWFNKYGELHSFLNQPSEVCVCFLEEQIINQNWYKNGELHREKGLPAKIEYRDYELLYQEFYENGVNLYELKIN
jgi:hypothetical protein